MTDHTPEFLAMFQKGYGLRYSPIKPDYARCCESVWEGFRSHQCARKNGHGEHGAYCKQHDPASIKAKLDAQRAELDAKNKAMDAARKAVTRRAEFIALCEAAIREIAKGHADPHALAVTVLENE